MFYSGFAENFFYYAGMTRTFCESSILRIADDLLYFILFIETDFCDCKKLFLFLFLLLLGVKFLEIFTGSHHSWNYNILRFYHPTCNHQVKQHTEI